MKTTLTSEELQSLRAVNTPTISNAIERLGFRDSHLQATNGLIHCQFPEMPPIVGHACTLTVRASQPGSRPKHEVLRPYWDHFANYPAPRIVVAQELDDSPVGAFWGEVTANIHRALGCVGLVTNGTVRDLDEVRALGFQFLAGGLSVSHAYAHLEDFDKPVQVGGLKITPGDLIHADKHGAIVIPQAIARDVAAATQAVERYERPMIDLCKSQHFSTSKLGELMRNEPRST
jgi:4-hydroxy-4-methyl-2-oxoglutarate aldolase